MHPSWDAAYGAVPSSRVEPPSAQAASNKNPEASLEDDNAARKNRANTRDRIRESGHRVLIVDDERLILSAVSRLIRRLGFETVCVGDAREALEPVHADVSQFELVITDYRMPGMNGVDLALKLREAQPDLPVVLMSGFTGEIDPGRVESAGIRQVLSKPLTALDIQVCLERLTAMVTTNKTPKPPNPTPPSPQVVTSSLSTPMPSATMST